ncbi:hypothetical protein FRB99_001093 [Tulasnella sp. 403]|nr:hypothetical protein FRB99_001093 [Tulasnella sp. 403]
MVTLSSRKELRAIMDATGGGTVMMAGPRIAPSARLDFLTTPRPAVTGIKVSTTHTYHVDRNSAVDDGASQDIKLPLDTSDIQGASTFVVHRREASLSSKRSYSSSTYGPHMQELDFGEQEGGIEEEEIDMISVTGHGSNADRPFAPHPTVPVAIQATSEDGIVRKIVRPRTQDAVVGAVGASDVAVRPRATSKDANVMPIVVIEAS